MELKEMIKELNDYTWGNLGIHYHLDGWQFKEYKKGSILDVVVKCPAFKEVIERAYKIMQEDKKLHKFYEKRKNEGEAKNDKRN